MEKTRELGGDTNARWTLLSRSAFSEGRLDAQGFRRYIGPKRVVAVTTLTATIIGTWYLRRNGILNLELLENFVRDYPIIAPVAVILAYALGVVSGLPTLPINLAVGVFWGGLLGGLIAAVAGTLGAFVSFIAARSIFGRPLAKRFDNKLIVQFQSEFKQKGWRFIAFVRLNPVLPTGPLNYILGLTGIDTFTYVWATFAFVLAPSIGIAFLGDSVGAFVIEGDIARSVALILAASAAVTIFAAFAYSARLVSRLRRNAK